MRIRKQIWIAIIACATLLLVPALAAALRGHESAIVAGEAAPASQETDIPLPAIEYDPAVSASYPVLPLPEVRRMEALRHGAERLQGGIGR